jgi:serine/threonine protein kinase
LIEVNEAASAEVSNLIVRMMAVDPADRLQTMVAVRDEVKTLLESC